MLWGGHQQILKKGQSITSSSQALHAFYAQTNLQASSNSWAAWVCFSLTCGGGASILMVGPGVGGVHSTAEVLGEPLMAPASSGPST